MIIIIEKVLANESFDEQSEFLRVINLEQNFPNPFNPTTSISFKIYRASHVSLRIYDLMGREVEILLNKYLAKGQYVLSFEATNLVTGTYIYRLKTNNGVIKSKKMTLIK